MEEKITFELRDIPSVASLIEEEKIKSIAQGKIPLATVKNEIKSALEELRRKRVSEGTKGAKRLSKALLYELACRQVVERINKLSRSMTMRVINGTGILVHTNLGRSPFSQDLWNEAGKRLCGYLNLEYDLTLGERSRRGRFSERLLKDLTGAEGALIVNNCAGALFLILRALCHKKEVIVSRGELVQIGGGFRIPEIISTAGAKICEVGTTNQTTLQDYQNAISEKSSAICKVHKSNFQQVGFVQEVQTAELIFLAKKHNLILVEDIGSATVIPENEANKLGLNHPSLSIRLGADLITFSADKILGLCQGGIILGRADLIERLRKSPIYRTIRPDRTILTLLEEGLKLIADGNWKKIVFYSLITQDIKNLKARADALCKRLFDNGVMAKAVATTSEIGGGIAGKEIPSYAVQISRASLGSGEKLKKLAGLLRDFEPPVIAKLAQGALILDLRTVFENEEKDLVRALTTCVSRLANR